MSSAVQIPTDAAPRTAMTAVRALGVLAGAVGLYVAYGCVESVIREVTTSPPSFGIGSLLIVSAMVSVAVWCGWACYSSWRPAGAPPIRSLSAIVALCVFSIAGVLIGYDSAPVIDPAENAWISIKQFLLLCVASATYVILNWRLSRAARLQPRGNRIPTFVIALLGLFLWVASFRVLGFFLPSWPWGLLVVIAPFVIAIGFGKLLTRLAAWVQRIGDTPPIASPVDS